MDQETPPPKRGTKPTPKTAGSKSRRKAAPNTAVPKPPETTTPPDPPVGPKSTRPSPPTAPPTSEEPTDAGVPDRFKSYIAILIGLASVAGALATWQAVRHGSQATDADRRAVLETVTKERAKARNEVQLRFEESQFAEYRGNRAAADFLDRLAEEASTVGDAASADDYKHQADSLREIADNLATLTFSTTYVVVRDEQETFDTKRRREDLAREDQEAFEADPIATAREADSFRVRSQRLVGVIVVFALSVVLLSVGQLVGGRFRPHIAGAGAAIFILAAIVAVIGEL